MFYINFQTNLAMHYKASVILKIKPNVSLSQTYNQLKDQH